MTPILNGLLPDPTPLKAKYLARNRPAAKEAGELPVFRNFYVKGYNPDQADEDDKCITESFLGLTAGAPFNLKPIPFISPTAYHLKCQLIDPWRDKPHLGTTIIAGATVAYNLGIIGDFFWADNVDQLAKHILTVGPAIIGGPWCDGMCNPIGERPLMKIRTGGNLVGGHCTLVHFVNTESELFGIKNTWGSWYGNGGYVYMPFAEMQKFLDRPGTSCCLPMVK